MDFRRPCSGEGSHPSMRTMRPFPGPSSRAINRPVTSRSGHSIKGLPQHRRGLRWTGAPPHMESERSENLQGLDWVIFVCFATSAVHLELISDYSSDGVLAAYRRFVSRRGIWQTLFSDCGTNFQGADAELRRLFSSASKELHELAGRLANDGTKWKFNPPTAPHFGGKWEAVVRSVKHHLRRTIGDTLLTFEELTTLLTQFTQKNNMSALKTIWIFSFQTRNTTSSILPANWRQQWKLERRSANRLIIWLCCTI
uniref:uncharacterized protein LOC117603301 isoform X1 n=1 Tax=Osmia lignaria TaxID=473952 RepID=UPI0014797F89|nr:uncharacterized protein LOC117603301 isoform X1 [Osmia lignaria]